MKLETGRILINIYLSSSDITNILFLFKKLKKKNIVEYI